LHENVAGVVVHAVSHLGSHVEVHVGVAVPVHVAEHVASKLSGVHCCVQVALVSKWHVLGSWMVTRVPSFVAHVAVIPANDGVA
jgi:hypothetical protein